MASKKNYVVTAALVTAHTDDGRVHYFYAGTTLPDGIVEADIERLLDDGMIADPSAVMVAPGLGVMSGGDPKQTVLSSAEMPKAASAKS